MAVGTLGGIAALRCCLAVPSRGVSGQSCVCLLTHSPTTMAHRCEHRPQISAPLLLLVETQRGSDILALPAERDEESRNAAPVIISPLSCSWRLAETRRYTITRAFAEQHLGPGRRPKITLPPTTYSSCPLHSTTLSPPLIAHLTGRSPP